LVEVFQLLIDSRPFGIGGRVDRANVVSFEIVGHRV